MICVLLACCCRERQIKNHVSPPPVKSFSERQVARLAKTPGITNKPSMINLNFRYAAQLAIQATVRVKTSYRNEIPQGPPGFYYDFFDKDVVGLYGRPTKNSYYKGPNGTSSGVLISDDGYVVTNYHVVEHADRVEVILNNKRSYPAVIVGVDPGTDLALLKVKGKALPFLLFGNSDSLMVGDITLIAGNPLNFTSTVTQGIISFKARNITQNSQRWVLQSYIQTDGVVNIGNSGGALLDLDGKLTGIITAIASPDGVYAGYSFAIPVQVVKKTVDDFLKYGRANRGDLGAKVTEIDETRQISINGEVLTGIVLQSLEANGSTAAAGMAEGDIITQIDNLRMESVAEFSEYVARSNPGQKVLVRYFREGQEHRARLTLKAASLNH